MARFPRIEPSSYQTFRLSAREPETIQLHTIIATNIPSWNTSSRKNTEVKQLGPRLALEWVAIQGLDMDAVATNTVKYQQRSNRASVIYKNKIK